MESANKPSLYDGTRWDLYKLNKRWVIHLVCLIFYCALTWHAIYKPEDMFYFQEWGFWAVFAFITLIAVLGWWMNEQHYRDLKAGRSR